MEHGLTDGLLHPVTGLDHLAMLLTSGVLAALTGRRLGLPLLTLLAMVAGTAIGFVFGSYSLVEPAILTSLLVAGALLLAPGRMTLLAWVMPAFALFHGWAHGVEAPAAQVTAFTLGAVLAASALLAVGYLMGRHVITSYSIHYTKLYESMMNKASWLFMTGKDVLSSRLIFLVCRSRWPGAAMMIC